MWTKTSILPAAGVLLAASVFGANQAYALNDDEAAVLVGLAVGTVAAVAVKHHREHDRRDWEYRERRQEHHHHHYRERPPKRVEHYVIHNPPQYRERHHRHDRYCDDHRGKHKGHHKQSHRHDRGHRERGYVRSGYEYEYEYKKRTRF